MRPNVQAKSSEYLALLGPLARGVIPDIVTSAKGLTGSWQPLSMVGVRYSDPS